MTGRAAMRAEGGCQCGAVRYVLSAAPTNSMICHCRTCQKLAGAPVVAWITVTPEAFAFTKGEPGAHASSGDVRRRFCRRCGTQLTYERLSDPSYVDVTTASLDDPGAFPPTHHSWLSHTIGWVKFGDGLAAYPESRSD